MSENQPRVAAADLAAFVIRAFRAAGRDRFGFSLHPYPAAGLRSPVRAAGVEFLLLHLPLGRASKANERVFKSAQLR